jgi:hypothetical protein
VTRSLRPILVALAIAGVLCGAAAALLELGLPAATASDRIGADALRVLQSTRGGGAAVRLGNRRLVAVCRRVGRRRIVSLSDGSVLAVTGAKVRRLRAPVRLTAGVDAPDLVAAEADLSGNHGLYVSELVGALGSGALTVRETRYDGASAYALRIGAGRPVVELVVDRHTLRPVAARYASSSLTGSARLRAATDRTAGC